MKGKSLLWLVFVPALAGCSRDFTPPPPEVKIGEFSPSHGFMGDIVGICGQNFDSNAVNNIVHFGTKVAEIVDEQDPAGNLADPGFHCDQNLLFTRVPELESPGEVSINVSSPTGQAVADIHFVYDGPGHPVQQRLKKLLGVRTGLWAVFTAALVKTLTFGTIGVEASTLGIFEPFHGLHLDFGVCGLPISGAFGVVDENSLMIVGTRMEIANENLGIEADIFSWTLNMQEAANLNFEDPEFWILPTAGGKPFAPNLVWSIPRPAPDNDKHDFVVSHLRLPAMAIVSSQDTAQALLVELPKQAPFCKKSESDRLGPIVDMAYDPVEQHIYVALAGSNDVWRVSRDGSDVRRMFPTPDIDPGLIDCSWSNAAMALRQSHALHTNLRLYLSDKSALRLSTLKLANAGRDEYLEPTLQMAIFDSIPYALATARYSIENTDPAQDGEHLYVATQNGLRVFDVSRNGILPGFRLVGEITVPFNNGGVQALAVASLWDSILKVPDEVLFVDGANTRVLRYTAGEEEFPQSATSTGSVAPQFAPSYDGKRFFIADSLSNAVHIVDRNSGLRTDQFPIVSLSEHRTMGFLSQGMTTLRRVDHDLLMVPLVEAQELGHVAGARYRAIAFGRIADTAPPCGLTNGGLMVDRNLDKTFNEMQLVSWKHQDGSDMPVLVLTRYFETTGDQTTTGETWCVELDPDGSDSEGIIRESLALCNQPELNDFEPGVRLVRSARNAPYIVMFENLPGDNGENEPAMGIRLIDLVKGDFSLDILDAELAPNLSDALVVPRPDQAESPVQIYMAMSKLGVVLMGSFDAEGNVSHRVIPTGGDPTFLSLSPDGRRVYVSHFFSNQLSIIGTDCENVGSCESVVATIDVDAWPGPVVFDDTGETAFLLHYKSNDISWLE
ncbi:MAG TPA: IPT/TIG domain-containing protein [Myxococcota bacterium]|nr:IPT/TIG domain-containing protein [Myxococcota bacterium]